MMKNYNFVGNLKRALIISAAIMLVGVACLAIFGVKMDISFKGGTRVQYEYTEAPDLDKIEDVAEDVLDTDVKVTKEDGGKTKLVTLTLTKRIGAQKQAELHTKLGKAAPQLNTAKPYSANTLSAAMGVKFLMRCLVKLDL